MPGKSRRGKRKYYQPAKKPGTGQPPTAVVPPAAASAAQPAAVTSRTPAPSVPKAAAYPYVTTELRNIGILTGIILVILIVLALILN